VAASGIKIAHLSDLHARSGVRPRRVEQAIEMINAAGADLVALTGDYVCLSARPIRTLARALARLRAPVYATLGNHDHWSGAHRIRAALSDAGIHVLTNQHQRLRLSGCELNLVGLDWGCRPEQASAAFEDVPAGATAVVLSHDPRSADFIHRHRPALILSGHTHGGQIYFHRLTPYVSARMGAKYLSGFFDVHGTVLYVNRGLGASVPLRFRAPVEVTLLTLQAAPPVADAA
jgi:predicted MPP superfamily phosphohydrolase